MNTQQPATQVDYKVNQQPATLNGNTFAVSLFNKPVDNIQNIKHQEEEILGFVLNSNEFAQTIFEQLTINHFSYKPHCIIFETAKHLFDNGKEIDCLDIAYSIDSNKLKYKELYNLFNPDPLDYLLSLIRKTSIKGIDSFNHRIKYLKETLLKHEITQALNNNDFEKAEHLITARKSLNSSQPKQKFSFDQWDLTANIDELRKKLKEEKFVLNGIALTGQITAIYAPPNTGKTLIVLRLITEAILQHGLNAKDILYINADDGLNALKIKVDIATEFGFKMIAPDYNGVESKEPFKISEFINNLKSLINDDACDRIIILDTLKKFVDLMDKRQGSEFMKVARAYTQKGGTMILLAHTNKNKGADGKYKYGGTSDVVDDCDCAYVASLLSENDKTKTIVFENIKNRGTNEHEVVFEYAKTKQGYIDLITSVKTITNGQIEELKEEKERNAEREKDKPSIEAIKSALNEGITKKLGIIDYAKDFPNTSRRKVDECLGKYTGVLWSCKKGDLNTFKYELIE